jgi:hypothetical protein
MQAKLRGDTSALSDTADQWCRAVKSGECRAGDELLLVVASTIGKVEKLAADLRSRRGGASLAGDALQILEDLAASNGLNSTETECLLDAAKILALDARDGRPQEDLGAACLDASVVRYGHGRAAFQALRAALQISAGSRAPSNLPLWRRWLDDAHLPLVADADGAVAARLQAQREALAKYRAEWAAEQDILPLADLGLGLTSISVVGLTGCLHAAARRGAEDGEPSATRDTLVSIVRRQGRLVLLGRPGTGKTVASRLIAAQWAATAKAPIPVWLRLDALASLLPPTGPYRVEIAELVRAAVGFDRPSLVTALVEKMESGAALLILDALDEVAHHRRDAVVEAVANLIGNLPADLDIVVTSRHAVERASDTLGLPAYELNDPRDLEQTLNSLLETAAGRFATDMEVDAWLADRRQRIKQSRHAEPDLWRVPLLATLMVLQIAEHPLTAVPASRAGLLENVIDSSVRRWEMSRPGANPQLRPDTLLDCFNDIAHVVAHAEGQWTDALAAVSGRLQAHWGFSPGAAQADARQIVEYWDATAGVFITTVPHGPLQARARLFADFGEARWAVRDSGSVPQWMDEALADTNRWESAQLAAGLSPTAAAALVTRALTRRGDLLDLAHDAVAEGCVIEGQTLHSLRDAQLERLTTLSGRQQRPSKKTNVFQLFSPPPKARLAVRLANDDLDGTQSTRLLAACKELNAEQAAVIAALSAHRQARQRGTALTTTELNTVQSGLLAPGSRDSWVSTAPLAGTDELVRIAVQHLLPARPEIGPAIVETAWASNFRTAEWLEAELELLDRHDLVHALRERFRLPLPAFLQDRDFWTAPFPLLSGLADPTADLTPGQAWHLDEAAGFIHALELADIAAGTAGHAVKRHPALTEELCRLALTSSGLSPSVVTTQLCALSSENPVAPDWGLLFQRGDRTSKVELAPEAISSRLILDALQTGNDWLVTLALTMTLHASEVPDDLPTMLLSALSQLESTARMLAAAVLAMLWPEQDIPTTDPIIRAGVARTKAHLAASADRHSEAADLLEDPDLLVRSEAARQLRNIPANVRPALELHLAVPAAQWTCLHCGAAMASDEDACANRHSRPPVHLRTD